MLKTARRRLKIAPIQLKITQKRLKTAPKRLKTAPKQLKTAPKRVLTRNRMRRFRASSPTRCTPPKTIAPSKRRKAASSPTTLASTSMPFKHTTTQQRRFRHRSIRASKRSTASKKLRRASSGSKNLGSCAGTTKNPNRDSYSATAAFSGRGNPSIASSANKTSQLPTALTFLAGTGRIEDDFSIKLGKVKGDQVELLLTPLTPSLAFESIRFDILMPTAKVYRVTIYDAMGNINKITFKSPEINAPLDDASFKFVPPADAKQICD